MTLISLCGTTSLPLRGMDYCPQHTPWLNSSQSLSIFATSYIDGFVQDCSNSSALAKELLQSCTKPTISTFDMSHKLSILPVLYLSIVSKHDPWFYFIQIKDESWFIYPGCKSFWQLNPQINFNRDLWHIYRSRMMGNKLTHLLLGDMVIYKHKLQIKSVIPHIGRTVPLLKPPQSPHCYLGEVDHAKKFPPTPGPTASPVLSR